MYKYDLFFCCNTCVYIQLGNVQKKTAKENTLWFDGKHYRTINGTKYLQIYTYTKVDWHGLKRLDYWVNADDIKS